MFTRAAYPWLSRSSAAVPIASGAARRDQPGLVGDDHDTIGAIVAAIVWTLFVEQVILAAIVPGVERWLPTAAAIGLTNAPGPGTPSPVVAGLVLAGYAVVLLAAASRTTMRRDVT